MYDLMSLLIDTLSSTDYAGVMTCVFSGRDASEALGLSLAFQ